jgi:hypothetical protein
MKNGMVDDQENLATTKEQPLDAELPALDERRSDRRGLHRSGQATTDAFQAGRLDVILGTGQ